MGYYSELSIDTRTCGEAAEDAWLDRRDGYYRPRVLTPAQEAARIREYLYQMQAFAWTATYQQAQARLAELEAAA